MTIDQTLDHSRRRFLKLAGGACAAGAAALASPRSILATCPAVASARQGAEPRFLKTLKQYMVEPGNNLLEKFAIVRDAGFDGIELDSPGLRIEEVLDAIARTGLPVDGTVCSTHWKVTHSNADPAVRAQALKDLRTAIEDTRRIGGNTVLLVVGHGKDGTPDEVWSRSIENIAQALPFAARHGIYIAIENVWNHFLYDHEGDGNQSADQYARYVDELNSPWVGMQFDIGNHWKYGDVGSWIRTLGKRIVKLDVKGYSRAKNDWAVFGEDDINWEDVRKALGEIGYTGWVAAEVGGGNAEYLAGLSKTMDQLFAI